MFLQDGVVNSGFDCVEVGFVLGCLPVLPSISVVVSRDGGRFVASLNGISRFWSASRRGTGFLTFLPV